MLSLLVLGVLCAVAGTSHIEHFLQRSVRSQETCTEAGQYICNNDCSELLLCSADGLTFVLRCENGDFCSSTEVGCVPEDQSDCAQPQFECHDVGAFPDLRNCSVFFICTDENAQPVRRECGYPWAFNPSEYDCSLHRTDPICNITYTCDAPEEVGIVGGNSEIYYICDNNLIPQLHRCHNGQIYDINLRICTWNQTTETPQTESTEYPSTLSTTPGPVEDSTSETSLTEMTEYSSTPATSSGTVEDSTSETTLTETTWYPSSPTTSPGTVEDSTSETTLTETTTSPGTVEDSTTPWFSTTPAEGETCGEGGATIADPNDCRSYFRCLGSWIHLTCIDGYHFDANSGGCERGDCSNAEP